MPFDPHRWFNPIIEATTGRDGALGYFYVPTRAEDIAARRKRLRSCSGRLSLLQEDKELEMRQLEAAIKALWAARRESQARSTALRLRRAEVLYNSACRRKAQLDALLDDVEALEVSDAVGETMRWLVDVSHEPSATHPRAARATVREYARLRDGRRETDGEFANFFDSDDAAMRAEHEQLTPEDRAASDAILERLECFKRIDAAPSIVVDEQHVGRGSGGSGGGGGGGGRELADVGAGASQPPPPLPAVPSDEPDDATLEQRLEALRQRTPKRVPVMLATDGTEQSRESDVRP